MQVQKITGKCIFRNDSAIIELDLEAKANNKGENTRKGKIVESDVRQKRQKFEKIVQIKLKIRNKISRKEGDRIFLAAAKYKCQFLFS